MGRVIKADTPCGSSSNGTELANFSVSVKEAIIESAAAMAARIVEAEIDRNPALLERMLVRSLVAARNLTHAAVRIHPVDRSAFDIDTLVRESGFSIEEDETVGRGGCRIVAYPLEVDASISTMIDSLTASLKGAL